MNRRMVRLHRFEDRLQCRASAHRRRKRVSFECFRVLFKYLYGYRTPTGAQEPSQNSPFDASATSLAEQPASVRPDIRAQQVRSRQISTLDHPSRLRSQRRPTPWTPNDIHRFWLVGNGATHPPAKQDGSLQVEALGSKQQQQPWQQRHCATDHQWGTVNLAACMEWSPVGICSWSSTFPYLHQWLRPWNRQLDIKICWRYKDI